MTSLVLSEGPNDLIFLSILHRYYNDGLNYDKFDNEREDQNESTRVRQHWIGERYDYLYKAEGGRPNISIIFADISTQLVDRDVDLFMLVDLDGESVQDLFDEINIFLTQDYMNAVSIEEESRVTNDHLVIIDCTIHIDATGEKPFKILAFHQSLEHVTGIADEENRASKRRKLREYVENSRSVINEICEHLYGN